ncbi:hypothetical protein [Xanthomonas sp. XNM01]|uniref:hypothetical protein n=1 Tax=Xanthomonas sp. XNM01 TaxID=2769289 RepID=UPI001785CA9C|nr:hypothetical protein [Xanthomonas sp. XNM01]
MQPFSEGRTAVRGSVANAEVSMRTGLHQSIGLATAMRNMDVREQVVHAEPAKPVAETARSLADAKPGQHPTRGVPAATTANHPAQGLGHRLRVRPIQ